MTIENGNTTNTDDIKVATLSNNAVAEVKKTASTMVKTMNNGAQTSMTSVSKNQTAKPVAAKASNAMAKTAKDKDRDSKETSLAFIMMVYVLVFLICHFPRLFLNLIELTTIR